MMTHDTQHITFWQQLPRPILGLAPMNGITDHPFRHIQKKYGRPPLLYTEFTSVVEATARGSWVLKDLQYDESQRPIVAQLYGRDPERFRQLAIVVCALGFDGIDINMGCPAPSVANGGSGAGLIRTPDLARAIVVATRTGIQAWVDGATLQDCPLVPPRLAAAVEARHAKLPAAHRQRRSIPVSVKTRIGYTTPQVEEWIPHLLEVQPAAIAIHGRTLQQAYRGQADWEAIGQAAESARGSGVLILGNGDVASHADACRRASAYGLDGVLIGRASYGNPFVFAPEGGAHGLPADPYMLLHIALEHATLYESSFGPLGPNHFLRMRKHLSWYARGLPGMAGLRRELVQTCSVADVSAAFDRYFAYRRQWEQPRSAPHAPPVPAYA